MGTYKQMYKTKGTDNQLIERANRKIRKINKLSHKQLIKWTQNIKIKNQTNRLINKHKR